LIFILRPYDILNEFRISSIDNLESHLNIMSPSICEYHLENIILYSDVHSYLNKSQINKEFNFGDFKFYFDYEDNIYLEKNDDISQDDDLTSSLW